MNSADFISLATKLSNSRLVDALQRCRGEPTFVQFREAVCAYARDVLRLPVRDE